MTIVEGRDDVGPVGIGAVLLSKEYVARKSSNSGKNSHHQPPVENSGLFDPEEGLDGPSEAVLVA